jgi:hypothetical protein
MIPWNVDNAFSDTLSQHFHKFGEPEKTGVLLANIIQLGSGCTVYHLFEGIHIVVTGFQSLRITGFCQEKTNRIIVYTFHPL